MKMSPHRRTHKKTCSVSSLFLAGLLLPILVHADVLTLHSRSLVPTETNQTQFRTETDTLTWDTAQTAVIICDMWDQHWCKGATERVADMAPVLNQFVAAARDKGVFIVHAPSSVVDYYKDYPARRHALNAPKADNIPDRIGAWCDSLAGEPKHLWPIDQSDGGCDCETTCQQGNPWRKQIDIIEIKDEDYISDDGVEIWHIFENRGIRNVILVGVHTNMCVIGRPFGLRTMKRVGKNVVLCRDLTDTMYNSRKSPYVSHFEGTALMIDYIEKYICPTIVSSDLTGEAEFTFKR